MEKEHNFYKFFFLTTSDNLKVNKKAVYWLCIQKYTLSVAQTRLDCFVFNKAKLCQGHLKKCLNFEQKYNDDKRKEILSCYVSEDEKKLFKETSKSKNDNNLITIPKSLSPNSFTITMKQISLTNYVLRSLSAKDQQYFKNLVLLMIVSNGLPFIFIENKKTQDVFNFIAPALKLSRWQAISDRIFLNFANELIKSILQITSHDKIGVIAAFDG